jgi:hypothetical protein
MVLNVFSNPNDSLQLGAGLLLALQLAAGLLLASDNPRLFAGRFIELPDFTGNIKRQILKKDLPFYIYNEKFPLLLFW